MGRGIVIALALSLAANVFLGGYLAGNFASGRSDHGMPHRLLMRHGGMDEVKDLSPAAGERLKRAFAAHRAEFGDARRKARALHDEFVQVIGADVFDRAAADAVVAKFDAIEKSGRAGKARLIVEAADGLAADDRKALARLLDRGRHDHCGDGRRARRGSFKDALSASEPEETPPTD